MPLSDLHGPWSVIRRSPMLRMTAPFLAGIIAGEVFDVPLRPVLAIVVLLTVPAIISTYQFKKRESRWRRGFLQGLWFLFFGLSWQAARSPVNTPYGLPLLRTEGSWMAEVTAINSSSVRSIRADARLIGLCHPDRLDRVDGDVLITLLRSDAGLRVAPGDVIAVSGTVEPITRLPDPGGFDRRKWAASRGIRHELLGMHERWRVLHHARHWTEVFAGMREDISDWLTSSGLSAGERALVRAMVLGERDELDGDRRDAFVRSGTVHVLAVSGMHVGLIFIVLSFLTRWWGKSKRARYLRGAAILIALWFYAALTGAAPSVLRATIMFTAFTVADTVLQRTESINSLFAAAMVLLLIDPGMIKQASFQLSFLAVLGIILFQRPIEELWVPQWKPMRKLWSLVVLSISAQTLTTPLSLYLFKAFPMWFLPANIIVVVAAIGAVYGGVALIVLHWLPLVSDVLVWALSVILHIIDAATTFFSGLPGAYPAVRVDLADMLVLYVLVLAVGAWWNWRWGAARLASFACLVALLAIWIGRADDAYRRAAFIVYDQPAGFMAGQLSGRELVVCSSSDSLLATEGALNKLRRHQRQARIERIVPAGIDYDSEHAVVAGASVLGGGRWCSPAFDVFLDDGRKALPEGHEFDAIVLHGIKWADERRLERLSQLTKRIVLAPDAGWGARKRIHEWADRQGVQVHDVRLQGAFVLEE